MAQITVDKIHDFNTMCDRIMDLDPSIRFAGVINERGKLVAGGMRKKLVSLTDNKTDEMLYMELALRIKMRKDFDQYFGKAKYTTTQREKVNVMSCPINSDALLIFTEPDIDFCNLVERIYDTAQTY